MKAIILSAGLGQRMRPLTLDTPKPLLKVGRYALIEYHLFALAKAGIKEVIINTSYHAEKFVALLGDGQRYHVRIHYSFEPHEPLETGGGIVNALSLLGDQPFIAISADLWTDYPFIKLNKKLSGLAHIVLTDNPEHHRRGDFCLRENYVVAEGEPKLNFGGIGIYDPKLFSNLAIGTFSYVPLLIKAIQANLVTGEHYRGTWINVGTIAQLEALQQQHKDDHAQLAS